MAPNTAVNALQDGKRRQAQALLRDGEVWLIAARESGVRPEPALTLVAGVDVTWDSLFLLTRTEAVAIVGRFDADAVPPGWTTGGSASSRIRWWPVARTLALGGQYAQADRAYQRALVNDPRNPGLLVDRAAALEKLGRPAAALALYRSAAHIKPNEYSQAAEQRLAPAREAP